LRILWLQLRTTAYDPQPISGATARYEQLQRLWSGDVHLEREDRKQEIEKTKLRRQNVPEDYRKKDTQQSLDEWILGLERELRDLDEIETRARLRAKVSPHQVQYQRAREVHELDMSDELQQRFRHVRTKMETFRERDSLVVKVRNDPGFSDEQKERLIAEIDKTADESFSPESAPGVSLYKRD
jgi:hypothetical protein